MLYRKGIAISTCILFIIVISFMLPAYAEVKSLKTDKSFYIKGSTIIFSGTVDKNDFHKQVNLVVSDPQNNFVGISGGFSDDDNKFEIMVKTTDPQFHDRFSVKGTYNATAFITVEKNGTVVSFDLSPDGSPVIHTQQGEKPTEETKPPVQNDNTVTNNELTQKQETTNDGKSIYDKINERIEYAKKLRESQTKTPLKIDVSESLNIQAYGDTSATQPTATEPQSPLITIMVAIAGGGIAIGTVIYSLNKRGHGSNNKGSNKKISLGKSITSSTEDYPLVILKNRLANGEITIEEYNEIKNALKEP